MNKIGILKFLIIVLIFIAYSCEKYTNDTEYITRNVIVIVIDGPRYSETWGDSSFANIPKMKLISEFGVLYTDFYNNGPTYTLAGHTALTTGNYQEINNFGFELPEFPSMFQYWNRKNKGDCTISRIFSSKDKLAVLSDCIESTWNGFYRPLYDCGINGVGIGSGHRHDSVTLKKAMNVLAEENPKLVLLSFREPDYSAHQNNWQDYIDGIKNTDSYVYKIWEFIEHNDFYKGKTSMFVTNDHGRHLDNINGGYISHGDTCNGCKHISLLALGPDFKKGEKVKKNRELIDIPVTIAEMLRFQMPSGKGTILNELFK